MRYDSTHEPTRQYSRRSLLQQVGGLTLTSVGLASLSTTATAQTTGSGSQGVFADGFDVTVDYSAVFSGALSSMVSSLRPTNDVRYRAMYARSEVNENEAAWLSYGNWLLDEADVRAAGDTTVGVTFESSGTLRQDESIETAINATYDDEQGFTSLDWVAEHPESPDYEVTLRNVLAKNAADELHDFRETYIDADGGLDGSGDHDLPSDAYWSRLAGKYGVFIELGPDERSVIEILLGEVAL